jgi:hypothetical protein
VVRDAGVVGVPDPNRGEAPIAFASTDPTVDSAELQSFVASRLAEYKRPREVILVDVLPRTPAGKLLRRELRGREPVSMRKAGTYGFATCSAKHLPGGLCQRGTPKFAGKMSYLSSINSAGSRGLSLPDFPEKGLGRLRAVCRLG